MNAEDVKTFSRFSKLGELMGTELVDLKSSSRNAAKMSSLVFKNGVSIEVRAPDQDRMDKAINLITEGHELTEE